MARIEFTVDADRGPIGIYLYGLEHFGPAQSERHAAALRARIGIAADNPDFGADYGFVLKGVRRCESISHAICYREMPGGIRILHGRMDAARHLS